MSQHDIIAFMCTVTSRRVGCGCTVWSFTTLGGCGLSLSLGLRPMKTHSSNYEMRSNYYVLGEARRGPLIPSGEKPGIRVKETQGSIRKVLYRCKIPLEISKISMWV